MQILQMFTIALFFLVLMKRPATAATTEDKISVGLVKIKIREPHGYCRLPAPREEWGMPGFTRHVSFVPLIAYSTITARDLHRFAAVVTQDSTERAWITTNNFTSERTRLQAMTDPPDRDLRERWVRDLLARNADLKQDLQIPSGTTVRLPYYGEQDSPRHVTESRLKTSGNGEYTIWNKTTVALRGKMVQFYLCGPCRRVADVMAAQETTDKWVTSVLEDNDEDTNTITSRFISLRHPSDWRPNSGDSKYILMNMTPTSPELSNCRFRVHCRPFTGAAPNFTNINSHFTFTRNVTPKGVKVLSTRLIKLCGHEALWVEYLQRLPDSSPYEEITSLRISFVAQKLLFILEFIATAEKELLPATSAELHARAIGIINSLTLRF